MVRKADVQSSNGVVGVVEGRYVRKLVTKEDSRLETEYVVVPDPEGIDEPDLVPVEKLIVEETVEEDAHTTTEPAGPGEYLTVVYRGIAQVKADASVAPIQVRDLLSCSGMAGHAALAAGQVERDGKALIATGTVIGKALETLAKEQGLIWVLVDLQ